MNYGTARRPHADDHLHAVHLLQAGLSPQHVSRMTGLYAYPLATLAPRRVRPSYTPAPPAVAYGPPTPSRADRIHHLLTVVALRHRLKAADLKCPRRSRRYAWPRQEAMFELQQRFGLSTPQIGRILGGRDHSTVVHGIASYKRRVGAQGAAE